MSLPDDLLLRVLAQTDQETRVRCGLASGRLLALLQNPQAWRDATVYALDAHALRFLKRVRPGHVTILASRPEDLAWFVHRMLAGGCDAHLLGVKLDLCAHMPPSVVHCLAEFARLERLVVVCRHAETFLAIPQGHAGLHSLREFTCVDLADSDELRTLEVYFEGASLPSLESVHVFAATSDILACARRFPRLHTLTYIPNRDSFEDAQLQGMSLRNLRLGVPCEQAQRFCMSALASMQYAEEVALWLSVPLTWDTYVNLRDLEVVTRRRDTCAVELVYPAARHIETVSIVALHGAAQGDRQVEIRGSDPVFRAWCRDHVHVGQGCKVSIRQ